MPAYLDEVFGLTGRTAVVTGGSSGIGRAMAVALGRAGARILLVARRPAPIAEVVAELGDFGVEGHAITADLADRAAVAAVIEQILTEYGEPDVLVNSAGVAGGGMVHLLEQKDWDFVLDVNLKGTYLVSKHVLPVMLAQGSGSIVNIASVEGIEGFLGGSSYNASKGGVVLLTKNMAIDYARAGIRVNVICPGFIDTPFVASAMSDPVRRKEVEAAVGKVGTAEQIAECCAWLVSPAAEFVHGATLIADGGILMR